MGGNRTNCWTSKNSRVRHVNYKSDFVLRERFCNSKREIIPLPDGDFTLRYWVKIGKYYEASRVGDVYTNCVLDGDSLLVLFKEHNLGEGALKHELHIDLDNEFFGDGKQSMYYADDLNVELWQYSGDTEGALESSLIAAYTRGNAFTYEDFTAEQIAVLQQPATTAAAAADKATAAAIGATETLTKSVSEALSASADATAGAKTATESSEAATKAATEATTSADSATAAAKEATVAAANATSAATTATTDAAAATKAATEATAGCNSATTSATEAAVVAQTAAANAERVVGEVEALTEQIEAAAINIPTGMRVTYPSTITLGNSVPRFIVPTLLPTSVLQNVIYLAGSDVLEVEPSGEVKALSAGEARIHVVPTAGVAYYKTINISVVKPSMRVTGGGLRLDSNGNIRLT